MPEAESPLENEVTILEGHIRIRFRDSITLKSQRKLVDQLVELSRTTGKKKFIVDTRGCALQYSVTDRYDLGAYFAEKAGNDLVVATIIDKVHLTGLVENVAHNRGATKLAILTDEGQALEWIESHHS